MWLRSKQNLFEDVLSSIPSPRRPSHRWLLSRQPARNLSMFLSIERNRSDENCSLCLIRQLGSSLYFGRYLSCGFRSFPERLLIHHDGRGNAQECLFQALGSWIRGSVVMTSCSPNFFNTRLGERDYMKPINELLQAMKVRKSVDQHTDSGS